MPPVYEYIEVKSGETVEFVVPIKQRDQVPGCRRVTVPRRLHVLRGTPDPTDTDQAVPRALRQLEETTPHDRIARESGYSTKHMKKVWGI